MLMLKREGVGVCLRILCIDERRSRQAQHIVFDVVTVTSCSKYYIYVVINRVVLVSNECVVYS